MTPPNTLRRLLVVSSLAALAGTAGSFTACDPNEPARASVVNDLPAEGAEAFTIEKAWYRTTLFFRPVAPGTTSESSSIGFGKEPAYFVLAIGEPPRRYLAVTTNEIETEVGEQARILVNTNTIRSTCLGAPRMSEEEWTFVRERIFPGDDIQPFEAACYVPPPPPPPPPPPAAPAAEAGADGATDAAGE